MHSNLRTKFLPILISILQTVLVCQNVSGQCPAASFTVPSIICAGTPLPISNLSSNAVGYQWDFTAGFFRNPGVKISDTAMGVQYPTDITFETQNDTAIAFFAGSTDGKIHRAIYANGIENPMTSIEDLGNLGILAQPFDIALYKENNEWYGLVVDNGNYSLSRFHLGTSLLNIPDNITLLFNSATSNLISPWSIKIFPDSSGNIFAMATNFTAGSFTLYEFGSSILNTPIVNAPVIIPATTYVLDGIIAKECGNYYGFFAGYNSTNIIKANFGTTINTSPTFTTIISEGSPSDLELLQDSAGWKLITSNYSSSEIRKYDLGNSLSGNTAISLGLEYFGGGNPKGIEVIRKGNSQYVAIQNGGSSNIQIIKYTNEVAVSTYLNHDSVPLNVTYSSTGIYSITLTAFDNFGNSSCSTQQVQVINAPISNFEVVNQCFGDSINFIDSSFISGGSISSWNWDFGDGNSSTLQNPTHLFTTAGTFNVNLTTSSGTCDNTIIKQITISPKPIANFTTSIGCSNTLTPFSDLSTVSTGSISSWSWNFGNGDTSTLQNPIYAFTTGGNYLVSLTVISDQNCSSNYSSNLVVNSSPIAGFNEINTCVGQQVNFSNLTIANGSTITSYLWNFGDGNSDTAFSPNHSYPNSIGNYLVDFIVTASNGCNDTVTREIRISNIPVASFNFPTTLCQGNSAQFTDLSTVSGDTISSWSWDFGDGEIDSIASPNHIYNLPGTYTVNLIAYSPTSCPSPVEQQTITVLESPHASFTYSGSCLGSTTSFTDQSTPASGSSIVSYLWNFTANDSSVFANTFFTFDSAGSYPVTLTIVSTEGCIDQEQMQVGIHPQPQAAFISNLPCSHRAVQFTSQSTCDSLSTISQYLWNFGDFGNPGTNTSTLSNPTHQYDTTLNYSASLIIITNFGCSDTLSKFIRVNQTPNVQFTYSPTCFGDLMEFFNPGSSIDSLYLWNFGDNQTNQLKEPAHYYIVATNYQVTLTVTSTKGCTASSTKQVTVSPIPAPAFSTPPGCVGGQYTFIDNSTISSGSIANYEWNIQEPNINLNGSTANYTFNDTGTYHVTLLVTSDIGCQKSISHPFSIHTLPIANFSFDPQYGNPPLAVQFTDQSQNSSSYVWTFGVDSITNFEQNPPYLYSDTGLYTITQIVTSSFGCKDTIQKNIYVIKPVLDIAVVGDSSYTDENFFYIVATLSNLGTLEINSVLMEARLSDGNTIREKLERSIPNGTTGIQNYHFVAAFRLSSGINSESYCISAINPNGQNDDVSTNNEKCYTRTNDISILNPFPNPTSANFNIRLILPYRSKLSISMFDQTGRIMKEIFEGNAPEGFSDFNIDTQNLSDGIYTIRIIHQEKAFYRQIVVVHTHY